MKIFTLAIACIITSCSIAQVANIGASNTWTRKADFGGVARTEATGFAIGDKIYLGLGYGDNTVQKDFWEYDPATDKWTRKANFGGDARSEAVGFSINGKGYIGIGWNSNYSYFKDFWEYDPATDKWTQKADFGGTARGFSTGFTIGNKGYIGAGFRYDQGTFSDVWEYDPATDKWTRKADFGGGGRSNPTSFSIGTKGYMGVGWNGGWNIDFYEYDPATDKWTRKADFGGSAREWVSSFSIGNKGYIGLGYPYLLKDFWEYDPATDKWTRKADFGGAAREQAVGVSVGNKGYFGTGVGASKYSDFWEYTPDENICNPPSDLKVASIADTAARLHWILPDTSVCALQITYRRVNSAEWIKKLRPATADHIILKGLTPNTTYRWGIRSICGKDSSRSEWVSGPDFTTASSFASSSTEADAVDKNGEKINVQVIPNPSKGNFTIYMQLPAKEALTTLALSNSFGERIWQQQAGTLSGVVTKSVVLDNKLATGIYVLYIERSDMKLVQKIVVSK